MPDYRAYLIGSNDRVISRKDLVAPTDEAALETARQYVDGADVEVWQRALKVGRLSKTNPSQNS